MSRGQDLRLRRSQRYDLISKKYRRIPSGDYDQLIQGQRCNLLSLQTNDLRTCERRNVIWLQCREIPCLEHRYLCRGQGMAILRMAYPNLLGDLSGMRGGGDAVVRGGRGGGWRAEEPSASLLLLGNTPDWERRILVASARAAIAVAE